MDADEVISRITAAILAGLSGRSSSPITYAISVAISFQGCSGPPTRVDQLGMNHEWKNTNVRLQRSFVASS
jgi:hypothetical protein